MPKHTAGPWEAHGVSVMAPAPDGEEGIWQIASLTYSLYPKNRAADAARIAACVNACDGINPEAVPLVLEALKRIATIPHDLPNFQQTVGMIARKAISIAQEETS